MAVILLYQYLQYFCRVHIRHAGRHQTCRGLFSLKVELVNQSLLIHEVLLLLPSISSWSLFVYVCNRHLAQKTWNWFFKGLFFKEFFFLGWVIFYWVGSFFAKVIYPYKHSLSHSEVSWEQLKYECDETFYTSEYCWITSVNYLITTKFSDVLWSLLPPVLLSGILHILIY